MHAYDRTVRRGADLDKVAELVGDPEAIAAFLVRGGLPPAGEGIVDASTVFDLTHDGVIASPDPHQSAAAAVPHAVGRDLARGEDQVLCTGRSEPKGFCRRGDPRAQTGEVLRAEGPPDRRRRDLGQRILERGRKPLITRIRAAEAGPPRVGDQRVVTLRRCDRGRIEGRHVVGADGPQVRACEGHVGQRFVPVTFRERVFASARPDALTDDAYGLVGGMAIDEPAQRRDKVCRVGARVVHVDDRDQGVVSPHPLTEPLDLAAIDDDERGLARRDALLDECGRALDEVQLPGIQEGLMAKLSADLRRCCPQQFCTLSRTPANPTDFFGLAKTTCLLARRCRCKNWPLEITEPLGERTT